MTSDSGRASRGWTTLAEIIANETKRRFIELSATASGVKELREVMRHD